MDNAQPKIIQKENMIVLEDSHADSHDQKVILDENTIILASGDAYSLFDMEVLKSALKRSHKSYEDIAEEKNISVSSIYKFISKKSKSPSFYNTIMLFDAAGVSVDELCNLSAYRNKTHSPDPSLLERLDRLENMVSQQNRLIAELTAEIKRISTGISDDY